MGGAGGSTGGSGGDEGGATGGSAGTDGGPPCFDPTLDTDMDGTPDCQDGCPYDKDKLAPGKCGCGVADNDSHGFFEALGDSVVTGPTLTNVNDFRVVLVGASSERT